VNWPRTRPNWPQWSNKPGNNRWNKPRRRSRLGLWRVWRRRLWAI